MGMELDAGINAWTEIAHTQRFRLRILEQRRQDLLSVHRRLEAFQLDQYQMVGKLSTFSETRFATRFGDLLNQTINGSSYRTAESRVTHELNRTRREIDAVNQRLANAQQHLSALRVES